MLLVVDECPEFGAHLLDPVHPAEEGEVRQALADGTVRYPTVRARPGGEHVRLRAGARR
jgi:hypothetical protein